MVKPVLVGAVLYDPKVSLIWDIIRGFFDENGAPTDVVFYTNYELQVSALLEGHIDIAWNSPLAWVDAQRRSDNGCRAIAMRDTDRDRVSHWIVRAEGGPTELAGLAGKTVAVGALDSPQATLIPLGQLHRAGLIAGRDVDVRRFDVLVGKHGDHIGGEREAFECLRSGDVQASAMLDLNWQSFTADGTINPREYRILATTERFDHCVFTVRRDHPRDVEERWLNVLFSMSYENPAHREMMDLEGLKAWEKGRETGFGPLSRAVADLGYFESRQ